MNSMLKLNHSASAPGCILPHLPRHKGAFSLHVFSVWIPSEVSSVNVGFGSVCGCTGALKSSPRWISCLHLSTFTSLLWAKMKRWNSYWEEPGSRRQQEPLTRRGQREFAISKLYMCFVFGIIPPDASLLNSCSSLRWFCFPALWSCY